jgi:hypothetical protein
VTDTLDERVKVGEKDLVLLGVRDRVALGDQVEE